MNPTVEELKTTNNYSLIEEFDFGATVPFLLKFLGKFNYLMNFYYLFHLIMIAAIGYFIGYYITGDFTWFDVLKFSFLGFLFALFPGIFLHEAIHILAVKILGAKKIAFGVEWKYMMFYVAADKFVMNKKQFLFVAFAPFVLTTIALLWLAATAEMLYPLLWLTACFIHGTMCIGDFGLINYYIENRNKEIFTYDNTDEKKTYFYQKIKST